MALRSPSASPEVGADHSSRTETASRRGGCFPPVRLQAPSQNKQDGPNASQPAFWKKGRERGKVSRGRVCLSRGGPSGDQRGAPELGIRKDALARRHTPQLRGGHAARDQVQSEPRHTYLPEASVAEYVNMPQSDKRKAQRGVRGRDGRAPGSQTATPQIGRGEKPDAKRWE